MSWPSVNETFPLRSDPSCVYTMQHDQRGGRRAQCMKNPVPIGVGYLAQYIVKPLLGFCIAKVQLRGRISSPRPLAAERCWPARG